MPQMKPMNWLMLFLNLNLILIFINIMNYFIKNSLINNKNKKNNKMMKYWKW